MTRVLRDRSVRIVAMAAEGLSPDKIARDLKMARGVVHDVLQRHDLIKSVPFAENPGPKPYSADELETLRTLYLARVALAKIAEKLGRSRWSVEKRLSDMRRNGELSEDPSRRGTLHGHHINIKPEPPVRLRDDDRVIRDCLAQGGFPRATVINGKTYWLNADNGPWRHTPRDVRRLAA